MRHAISGVAHCQKGKIICAYCFSNGSAFEYGGAKCRIIIGGGCWWWWPWPFRFVPYAQTPKWVKHVLRHKDRYLWSLAAAINLYIELPTALRMMCAIISGFAPYLSLSLSTHNFIRLGAKWDVWYGQIKLIDGMPLSTAAVLIPHSGGINPCTDRLESDTNVSPRTDVSRGFDFRRTWFRC